MTKKRGYFDLSSAADDVSFAIGAGETVSAGAKLIGKGLFNIARFAVTTGVDSVLATSANKVLQNVNTTEEQKSNAIRVKEQVDSRIENRRKMDEEWEKRNR